MENIKRPQNNNDFFGSADDKALDLRDIFFRYIRYWYLLAIIFPIMVTVAFLYLKYTVPIYQSSSIILIKDDGQSGQLSEEQVFRELGLSSGTKNLDNEKLILKSSLLMKKVVEQLNLQFTYKKEGRIRSADLYPDSPIKIIQWEPQENDDGFKGELKVLDQGKYSLKINEEQYEGEFGKTLILPSGAINITIDNQKNTEGTYSINVMTAEGKAINLSKALQVSQEGKSSSALVLNLQDVVPQRSSDILNTLIEAYNQQAIDEKNRVFENTLRFIDERINLLTDELAEVEGEAENYKSRYSMLDMTAEATMLLNELSDYRQEASEAAIQLEILESIERFLAENKDKFEFVPTNLTLTNLTLTPLLQRFNNLLQERAILSANLGPKHPSLTIMDKQLDNLRESIIANIGSIKKDLIITQNAVKGQRLDLEARLQSLPRRERELIEIERQKSIKENLYIYLLQKREETALSLAVATGSARIIEPGRPGREPIEPKAKIILLIAGLLGFLIPFGIAYVLISINDKVESEADVSKHTEAPLAGIVTFSKKEDNLVIKENSRSAVAEMFRLLRTNLNYIGSGEQIKTLLMTSSTSGEGKSFIALNLAMTQALSGKKVLILELDLRKPKQERYIGTIERQGIGISNYIVDHDLSKEDIIRKVPQHPNLHIITAGPTPPNPGELILSDRLKELLITLKKEFDFIILDAPPIGLVADAMELGKMADATLYVVRQRYTRRGQLAIIEDIYQNQKLPKPFVVLNAVTSSLGGGYGYGYRYGYGYGGYGYGYGYYQED